MFYGEGGNESLSSYTKIAGPAIKLAARLCVVQIGDRTYGYAGANGVAWGITNAGAAVAEINPG